ncbi:hypothetical protein ACIO7M_12705 [Streptomyces toxytricini]|uniref:Uncharacterized protein n=1 Tax=Streptomyces toxytricini TaxID=67369 RepID=A0ABW8EFE9_STRT5
MHEEATDAHVPPYAQARAPRSPVAEPARIDAPAAPDGPAGEKSAFTAALLRLRRNRPGLLQGYRPLPARGSAAEHRPAFTPRPVARGHPALRPAGTALPVPPGRWSPLPGLAGLRGTSYESAAELSGPLPYTPVAALLREAP